MGYNEKTKSQLLLDNEILRKRILELEEAQRSNEFLERALLESEQRFRDLYENAPLGYQSMDEKGNIVEVNDAWCDAMGYQRADIIGMNFTGFLTMESSKIFKERFPRLKETGKVHSAEFELIKKDGSKVIMLIEGRATYDIQGKFERSHCILTDITERKHTKDKLLESERRLKKAQEMSKVGDYEWILDSNKITWSDGLYKIFGFEAGTPLTYERLLNSIHPDDRENNTEMMNKWLREGGGEPYEYRIIRTDGTIRYIYEDCEIVYNEEGKVEKLFGVVHDITDHKQAEEELQKSEESLRKVMKASGDYIMMLNNEHKIQFINRTEQGINSENIIGIPLYKLVDTKDQQRVKKHLDEVINKNVRREYETVYHRPDGTDIFYYSVAMPLITDGKTTGTVVSSRDITEHKLAEEILRERENKLESIFRAAPIGIGLVSSRVLLDVNDQLCEMTGFSKKELVGKNSRVLYSTKEDYDYVGSEKYRQIKKKGTGTVETRFKRKDGKVIEVLLSSTPLNPKELKGGVTFTALDITERKKIEKEIKEWKNRYESAVASSGHILYDWDSVTNEVTYGGKIKSILGYSTNEMEGGLSRWIELIHPDDKHYFKQKIEYLISTKKSAKLEYRVKRKDGKYIYVEDEGQFIKQSQNKITRMIGFVKNITERKRAEEAVRSAEEKYRSIFENAVEGIYQTTPDGKFISANPALANMLGYKTTNELIEKVKNVEKQLYVDPKERDEFKKLINKQGIVRNYEIQLYRKDRKKIWVSLSSRAVRDSKGKLKLYEGTFEDITERKKAEDEIKNSREQLRNLSSHLQSIREEERGVIAREIHDDLGQSLTALKMDVSWLKKHLHKDKEKTQTKINGMNFLISETIRSVQRISSELRPGLLDDLGLSSAIQWYANEFINRTGIKCIVTINPKEIKLEEKLSIAIYRIFQESLTNVIRHANATKVNVGFTLKRNNLNLVVKDNGIGIQNDIIHDPTTLGLIGMQERLYPWNGTVTICGSKGKGTTVEVNLLLKK